MVPIRPGVGEAVGEPERDALGTPLALGEVLGLGDGVAVASATFGAGGTSPDRTAPIAIAAKIAPSVAAIDASEQRSVGKTPSAPGRRATSVAIAAPPIRQTLAHDGSAPPRLRPSAV